MDTTPQLSGGTDYGDVFEDINVSFGAVLFETFLYGIYTILFMICTYIILQRRHNIHWIFPVLGLALYTVASADMAYTIWLVFGKFLKGDLLISYAYIRPHHWLYITNSFLADTLLLYRCYTVWNRDKRIVVVPAILLISTTVCGYTFAGLSRTKWFPKAWVYLLLTVVLNVMLTALTASRIWWVSRKARKDVHSELHRPFNSAIVILIESGCLYTLYLVLDIAFTRTTATLVLDIGLVQMAGIMPTLILAQVSLGRACQDVEDKFTMPHTINFINSKAPTSRSTPLSINVHLKTASDVSSEDQAHRNKVKALDQSQV